MEPMKNYIIWAHPNQYESVMELFYQQEIFPFEEDPKDLQDYIDHFNFTEQENSLIKFYLCGFGDVQPYLQQELSKLPDYDKNLNLPRIEADTKRNF